MNRIHWLVAAVAWFSMCSPGFSATMRTFGPFDVYFYGNGESDVGYTGTSDWTEEQINDVAYAINAWDRVIENVPRQQIVVKVFWSDFTSGGWVNSSIDEWPINGRYTTRTGTEEIWREGRSDPFIFQGYHIRLRIQRDVSHRGFSGWNFGEDAPEANEWDFRTVMLHEFGHPIGHTANITAGNSAWFANDGWVWAPHTWEYNLVDADGDMPVAGGGTGSPGNFNQEGLVYWAGSHANALYGGPIPIDVFARHADLPYGSTIMTDQGTPGVMLREPTALDRAFLRDLGWSVVEVPEPSALLLAALVAPVLFFGRKRVCR